MKLQKLIIENIASIEKACIDFEHGPLGEDSIFLICGPTGAGKTTILDAMCFSLYGDASGEKREAKMLRSNQADAASATEVDFTFAIGAAVYRVWRSPEQLSDLLAEARA